MDAKPQRLRAGLRVRDENLPPANMANMKTLHSRNKSTPALSSLMKQPVKTNALGLNNNASKNRTAFADVSNTVRGSTAARDDLAILKDGYNKFAKPTTTLQPLREVPDINVQTNKQPALLRPAQRPLSALLPRAAPTTQSTQSNVMGGVTSKRVEHEQENKSSEEPVVKVLNRKRTTIFREQQPAAVLAEEEIVSIVKNAAARTNTSSAPVHQILEAPKEKKLPSIPEPVLPTLQPVEEQYDAPKDEVKDFSRDLIETIEQTFAKAEEALNPQPVEKEQPALMIPSRTSSSETIPQVIPEARSSDQEVYLPALETQVPPIDAAAIKLPVSAHSDLDDYIEEEDDEYYDAEGNTTARSIRSRGDNTTGGLTTFLEPRVTSRVMRELEAARDYVIATRPEDDIEDEAWDTSMVAEYGDDIFEYMRKLEVRLTPSPYKYMIIPLTPLQHKMRPNEHYMDNQNEIQWSMRAVLMDWMIQVHQRFGLLPETLFLAVNYIDRFLSCKVVSLGKLQLVGATALFVAAKYEEINCPSVQEIVYMVDNAYSVDEILTAERFMLSMLQFELGWPGPMSFLRRISKADEYDLDTRTMAKYFLEVMIMDERFVACPPSFAAAGAHCLSRLVLEKGDWGLAHTHYSQYTYWQLFDLVAKIIECCSNPRKHHQAVFEKYQEKKYKKCSLVAEAKLTSAHFKIPGKNYGRDSFGGAQASWGSGVWRKF